MLIIYNFTILYIKGIENAKTNAFNKKLKCLLFITLLFYI
jgi:hypothetical protein